MMYNKRHETAFCLFAQGVSIMKDMMKLIGIIALAALTGFLIAGCRIVLPEDNGADDTDDIDDGFVPVANITDVNTSVAVGTISLGGRVIPYDATNQIIKWSLQPGGDIEGKLSGNKLTTTEEGFLVVRATVEDGIAVGENYTKNFYIFVEPFVAVSYIVYDGPTYDDVGEIYLDATVYPDDASYTDIVWSVRNAGTTRATIKGDILTTKAEGTVTVRATIINGAADGQNYTEDFSIFVRDDDDNDFDDPD